MLTCLRGSYASCFSQHKDAYPIFWLTLSAKTITILCLGYSLSQIDFFFMAHMGHRGLAKFIYWKEGKKGEKKKRKMNNIVHTSIQYLLNLNQLFIGWQTSFTFTTNISNEVIQLWDHTKWIINLKKKLYVLLIYLLYSYIT